MGVLHLVNRSPCASLGLVQCLERVGQGDAVLLLEGGVYAARQDSVFSPKLKEAMLHVSIHALLPDLVARGIGPEEILDGVALVEYEGFVRLTLACSPILSWF